MWSEMSLIETNASTNATNVSTNATNVSTNVSTNVTTIKPKKKYKTIMAELLKPPPKEEKSNVHLSGGGQFSKLDKI
jgi:hypothetical protein